MKLGFRFSAKARGPSLASLVPKMIGSPMVSSWARPSASVIAAVSRIDLSTALTASGPFSAMRSASSRALVSAWPSGTTWPMRPDLLGLGRADAAAGEQQVGGVGEGDLALEADGGPAEREQAPLHLGDAELGGVAGDPDLGGLEDLGAAGHAVALDGGDDRLRRAEVAQQRLPVQVRVLGQRAAVSSPMPVARALRSMPEQKSPPAPVRMPTRSAGSSSSCFHASAARASMSGLNALRASGRLSVTVITAPSMSTRRSGESSAMARH